MPTTTGTSQNDRKPTPTSSSKPVPAWLPISLLAVTTVALAVPIVLLRRQRSSALVNTLPPRRAGDPSSLASRFTPIPNIPPSNLNATQWPPPRRRSGATTSLQGSPLTLPASSASFALTAVESDGFNDRPMSNDEFNAPLYTAKAFGIATLLVAVCACAAVWSVKTSLDVKDTREFGDRIRDAITTQLPYLSHRIHRLPDDNESPESTPGSDMDPEWKWTEAEERLNKALNEGGPSAWAEALVAELEREERRLDNDSNNNNA